MTLHDMKHSEPYSLVGKSMAALLKLEREREEKGKKNKVAPLRIQEI